MGTTPDYYEMGPYQDVHAWVAQHLRAARWRGQEDAILLDLLYFNALRYVRRAPFKGITPGAILSDIDKAIATLLMLADALRGQAALPQDPATGERSSA